MSIKNLFGKGVKSYASSSVYVESPEFVSEEVKERETYIPPIDFTTASNFVKYGLAEVYYADSISRIYNNYPYDGSKLETIQFHQSSSYLDRWMYEEKYPKTTGYINLGTTADWGGSISANYGSTNTPEFIRTWGGIHTASAGMIGKPLRETFEKSGKYDLEYNRTQNWRLNFASGSTVEFWLKIPTFPNTSTETQSQVILDLWNGVTTPSDADYGRLILEVYKASGGTDPVFRLTLRHGTNGFIKQVVSTVGSTTDASMANWHHYALSFIQNGSQVWTRFYVDGQEDRLLQHGATMGSEVENLITGYMGALQTTTPSGFGGANYGKLSGSLDEFRFWKKERTGQQIGLNWFRQIGGGANSDNNSSNTDLGVYYKFNEGITGYTALDQKVLDYSGRIANGYWQGYTSSTQRNTGSAFASSSFAYIEEENPIIYSDHPKVVSLESEMAISGALHDNTVGSSIFRSLPQWMTNEDVEEGSANLRSLTQIMASYFDTLHAQITALPNLKDKVYVQDNEKPLPFASHLLTDRGFVVRNLFIDSEIVNLFGDVDLDSIKFEQNLDRLRNLIYTNIYNNIEAIYKSKGTEKSIRNFLRCFGIDDEIVKLNVYTDGGTHYFTDKAKGSSVRKKYLNFKDPQYNSSTIFQTSSANNPYTFIFGRLATTELMKDAFTVEADVLFPYKKDTTEIGYLYTPFLSSSIFGFHEAREETPGNYMWATGSGGSRETANLQVYLVRDELDSKNGKFVLKNTDGTINLTSSYFTNIYENNHWNMAIRVKPDTYPYAGNVTDVAPSYTLDFYAVNYNFDELENVVHLTASLNNASGSAFLSNAKRIYAGAHYSDFTGSVLTKSDIEIGAVRSWLDYLEDSSIQAHNKDPMNYGNSEAFRGSNIFTVTNKNIPSEELTILNWEFDLVTGSSPSGDFIVQDLTSGSTDVIYSTVIDAVIRRENRGKGYSFGASKTTFAENEFIYAQKKELPEIAYTDDNIVIKTDRDINFIKDDDVSDNFYTLEKSMNQIISEEMLKMFSSVHEFANLMGRPKDRYRMDYKRLNKVRQDFFNRVEDDPDQERFIKFYKWIDRNISEMIRQLVPASVNFGTGATDVIESHILERNKYQRRVGLLDQLASTEGIIRGVEELTYNWKFGHAPVLKAAIGTIVIAGDPGNSQEFTLTDANGCSQVFITDTTSNTADGTKSSGKVIIGIQSALGSSTTIRDRFVSAINGAASNGDIAITATSPFPLVVGLYQQIVGTTGNTVIDMSGVTNVTSAPGAFVTGTGSPNENCVWQKERKERSTLSCQSSVGPDREKIREIIINQTNATSSNLSTVDKTIYQGSTFAARRLARPYKVGIDFGQRIHGGINYPLGKDREFYKTLISFGGGKNVGNAPENIYTVGITTGSSLIVQQRCDDVYNPNKKAYKFFECTAGKYATGVEGELPKTPKEEYMYKMHSSRFWPFNVVSGTLTSGYNKRVSYWFNSSSIVTNVHSDTTDYTNAIPIQGPFTDAWVGGRQSRHIDINKYDATLKGAGVAPPNGLQGLYTRPEAWRYLFGENPLNNPFSDSDGAMGLTGPDYGAPYPDQTKKLAMWYREERAKRPVNVKNILTTTASAVHGNYQFPYEVVSSFGISDQRFRMREILLNPTDGLFGTVHSTLPQTTQPSSLLGAGTFGNANARIYFRVSTDLQASGNGKTLTIYNPCPTNAFRKHTFTVNNSLDYLSSNATTIGTLNASNATKCAVALWTAFGAAITAGKLNATRFPTTTPTNFQVYLQANDAGEFRVVDSAAPLTPATGITLTYIRVGSGHRMGQTNKLASQLSGATTHKSVVRTRFSAPGGPETMSEDFLDVSSQEFSVYNAINYRNLSVRASGSGQAGTIRVNSNLNRREGNRTLLARWLGKGGVDSQWGSISYPDSGSTDPQAAFYKQHRNTLVTPRIKSTSLRKAINSPTTAVENKCYLSNQSVTQPWSQTGAISYSFWINVTTTATDQTILDGYATQFIKIDTDKIEVSFEDINTNENVWTFPFTNTNTWNFIVISWSGNPSSDITVFINNIEQTVTRTVTASPPNPIRYLNPEIYLLDGPAAAHFYELQGSLSDFAVWTTEFTPRQVSELYNANGKALGVSFYSALIDYWRLGTESTLSSIAVGSGISKGTIIPSEIGGNSLTAEDNLSCSVGPYGIHTLEDVNQHDNMNYNSLMPRSDFQYSWIRQSLSGSKWMDKQKVRGYAPKSGELTIVGNGALTKLESAINWPLISEIVCDNCDDDSALITLTWDADGDRDAGSSTSSDDTTEWDVLASGATPTGDYTVAVNKLVSDLVLSYTYSEECCDEVKYGMVVKGPLTTGGTKATYDSVVYVASPRTFVTNNGAAVTFTHAPGAEVPTQIKIVLTCDGASAELLITLKKVTIAIA